MKAVRSKNGASSLLAKKTSFSKYQLFAIASIFAVIGGYAIHRSFAAGVTYYISPTGSDGNACTQVAPCASFNRAYQVASPGDIVSVAPGAYAPTTPAEGANKILPDINKNSNSNDVTFICGNGAGAGSVTQAAPGTQFVITAQHVTITGSCFKFNKIWISDPANGVSTNDVTIDGVSMIIFDISGGSNVTVQNSQVGPSIACYSVASDITPATTEDRCQNNASTNEKYFFDKGYGNDAYNEPKIHSNQLSSAIPQPTNITIKNNLFTTMQTRDGSPPGLHTGCLWLGWGGTNNNIVIDGNKFERCAIYDIHIDAGGGGQTIQNNWFGYSVEPLSNTGQIGFDTETDPSGQQDLQCKSSVCSPVNFLIRYNTFSHGVNMNYGGSGSGATNVRIIGNILGSNSNCGYAGQTVDYNIFNSGSCGTNSSAGSTSSQVISATYPFNFHLAGSVGSKVADNKVTPTTSDYALSTDIDGEGRSAPRDAGADERGSSPPPPPTSKPGDLNNDGLVNITDLSILLSNYGTTNTVADINKDGTVNITDLSILLSNYGT